MMPNFDWEKIGAFVQTVGIPFACLLIFVGPFMWLAFSLVRKYGPRIAESHVAFLNSATQTQEKNAETLGKLAETSMKDHELHNTTHHAIGLVAEAGLAILDEDHEEARSKLQRVETVLFKQK